MIPLASLWWMVGLVALSGAIGWALGGPVGAVAAAGGCMAAEGIFVDLAPAVAVRAARRATEREDDPDGAAG